MEPNNQASGPGPLPPAPNVSTNGAQQSSPTNPLFDHVVPVNTHESELVPDATPRELKQLRAGAIPQLGDRTASQSPSADARDMSDSAPDIALSPVSEPKLLRAGV